MVSLGQFEQIVLTACWRWAKMSMASPSMPRSRNCRGRKRSRAARVYATLDRMEDKKLIAFWLSKPTVKRGGRSRRHYRLENPASRRCGNRPGPRAYSMKPSHKALGGCHGSRRAERAAALAGSNRALYVQLVEIWLAVFGSVAAMLLYFLIAALNREYGGRVCEQVSLLNRMRERLASSR